jgi:hypothetical protein
VHGSTGAVIALAVAHTAEGFSMAQQLNLEVDDLKIIKECLEEKISAMKNHIVSAVENPGHWSGVHSAESMARNLRRVENTFKQVHGALLRERGQA